MNKPSLKLLDSSAISLSGLCLLHCVLTTLVIPVFPMVATSFIADEWVHLALFFLACPLSVFTLSFGAKLHGKKRYFAIGITGLAFMALGLIHGLPDALETTLTTIGVVILALAHLGNYSNNRHVKAVDLSYE